MSAAVLAATTAQAEAWRPWRAYAVIQLWRNLDEGLLSADLSFLTAEGEDFRLVSEELVRKIVLRILDPAEPIRKTDDFTKCEHCPYKGICAR